MLRLRQEARRRADDAQKAAADGPPQPPPLPPLPPPPPLSPPMPAHDPTAAAASTSTSTAAAGAWLEPCSPPNRRRTGTPTFAAFELPAAVPLPQAAVSDANLMQTMGLPAGFTSTFHEQARQEAEEAEHDARVSDAWQRYNPYGRR